MKIENHNQKGAFGNPAWIQGERPHLCKKCKSYIQPKCTITDKFVKRTGSCSEWVDKYE